MTDRDNITLPREVGEYLLQMLEDSRHYWGWSERDNVVLAALRTHLAAPKQEHPGYVIGSHWLETAYSRVCAGEAEADVLRDIGLVRITDGMVETADIHAIVDRQEALRRENERLRDELRQSSIDHTRAEVERLRELLTEVRGAKWLVVQNNLLDRIDAALRREETT